MNLKNNSIGKTIVGIFLILFGITLFLSNFNIINDVHKIIFSWQIILIIVGIILFVGHKNSDMGLLLLIVGGIGLIAKINHTSMQFLFKEYWPILLIIIGLNILLKKSNFNYHKKNKHFENNSANTNS